MKLCSWEPPLLRSSDEKTGTWSSKDVRTATQTGSTSIKTEKGQKKYIVSLKHNPSLELFKNRLSSDEIMKREKKQTKKKNPAQNQFSVRFYSK